MDDIITNHVLIKIEQENVIVRDGYKYLMVSHEQMQKIVDETPMKLKRYSPQQDRKQLRADILSIIEARGPIKSSDIVDELELKYNQDIDRVVYRNAIISLRQHEKIMTWGNTDPNNVEYALYDDRS